MVKYKSDDLTQILRYKTAKTSLLHEIQRHSKGLLIRDADC